MLTSGSAPSPRSLTNGHSPRLPVIPELEPVTDHSDVSMIGKQLPPPLPKPRNVTDHDHCYWSEKTSSSPRSESEIDAREDSFMLRMVLLKDLFSKEVTIFYTYHIP